MGLNTRQNLSDPAIDHLVVELRQAFDSIEQMIAESHSDRVLRHGKKEYTDTGGIGGIIERGILTNLGELKKHIRIKVDAC